MTCAKQFWKKMYTGWVMSIERQGNQGSTIPDTMCVVPYIAFYVSVCYFTKTRSNLLWFWWLQNLAVHTNTYMLHDQLFLILSHLFFHNAIALPVLKFIFNVVQKRAVRIINNVGFLAHTHMLFYNCNILKISDLHLYKIWLFLYGLSKDNLRNNTIHSYPTRQTNHLHLPRTRTVLANKNIIFTGLKFWNSLNNELVESPSINWFKQKLRCFLLSWFV